MLRYKLKTMAGILLFCLLYAVTGLPLFFVREGLNPDQRLLAMLAWLGWGLVLLVPVVLRCIRWAWFFPTTHDPVSREALIAALAEVNSLRGPVKAIQRRNVLALTWKYDHEGWYEHLVRADLRRIPEVSLRFDAATRTVTMRDLQRRVDWSISPKRVTTGWWAARRPFFHFVATPEATIARRLNDPPSAEFAFTREAMKYPICNTILESGWNIRFVF